jgi:hypothetical protein
VIVEPEEEFFESVFHSRRLKHVRKLLQAYERRMRVFNLGVIVVALIALTILIQWILTAWMAFEKSIGPTF